MYTSPVVVPARREPDAMPNARHTVIPAPRREGSFSGWGVRF
jgi:hypothetical protein